MRQLMTEREREIARLVASDMSNEDIALCLVIEMTTVKTHLSSIRRKTGLVSRLQIAIYALKIGLISLDEITLPLKPEAEPPRTETISAAQCFAGLGLPTLKKRMP